MLHYYQQQPLLQLQQQKMNLDASMDKLMDEMSAVDNKRMKLPFHRTDL
jgi:hypothetical protein